MIYQTDKVRTIAMVNGELSMLPEVYASVMIFADEMGLSFERALAAYLISDIQRVEDVTIEGFDMLDRVGRRLCV